MFGYVLQLHWSLSLSDHFIVALEDVSLIQMNIDMNGPDITVQGKRREVLSPVKVRKRNRILPPSDYWQHYNWNSLNCCLWLTQVMENEGEFLALKLVSGQYAYSMEATCPKGGEQAENQNWKFLSLT